MFSRIKFEKTWSTKCGNRLCRLLPQGRKNVFENLFEKTCSTKCGNRLCCLLPQGRKNVFEAFIRSHVILAKQSEQARNRTKCGNRRQAFSVVGVKNMACPAIPKRRRKSSVSATFCLSPLPEIGEGFREWSEAPSYEEGVGGDGEQQGFALQNAPFFVSFLSVMKEMKNPHHLAGIFYF